jgi:hypothetical protein
MTRIRVIPLLALSTFALLTASAFAQPRINPGGVPDGNVIQNCQTSGGASRTRRNCDVETETKTTRSEIALPPIELAPLPSAQCEAAATTEYMQVKSTARVTSSLQLANCTAASGALTFSVRVRDESGEIKPLEFNETWQRSDDQDVKLKADYPIGENVELVSVRVRGLRCTCAEPTSEQASQTQPPQ